MSSLEYFMSQPGADLLVNWILLFGAFFLGVFTVKAFTGGR